MRHLKPMRCHQCFLATMTIMTVSILGGCQGDGKKGAANSSVEAKEATAEARESAGGNDKVDVNVSINRVSKELLKGR